MINLDEIEFLDCEIVEDDPFAPVGTLLSATQEATADVAEPANKKGTKQTQKKKSTPKKEVESNSKQQKNVNLSDGENVNDALSGASFDVQQTPKAKIVSNKKKQENHKDVWASASINKSKKDAQAQKQEDSAPETVDAQKDAKSGVDVAKQPSQEPTQKKKSTQSKTTKSQNTKSNTEEKIVAKATDKTVAPQEEKAVKAPKATKPQENNDETILVEGEGKIHGKFVIKKTDKGNFVFKLYSSNHRVVAIGAQAYTSLGAAKIGVQSIIKNAENAPVENKTLKNVEVQKFPKWEIYTDKKGEFRLRLFATNGSLIATTNDGYADISGAKNGIAAVARACKGCEIARNDNLW